MAKFPTNARIVKEVITVKEVIIVTEVKIVKEVKIVEEVKIGANGVALRKSVGFRCRLCAALAFLFHFVEFAHT